MMAPYPEPGHVSPSLAEYLPAFQGREDEPFLTFHPVSTAQQQQQQQVRNRRRVTDDDRGKVDPAPAPTPNAKHTPYPHQQQPTTLTRGELWARASRLARALTRGHGLGKGGRFVHLFRGNSVEDVALRVAATMVGAVPVTVNWDSDPVERILYKVQSSGARVVLTHAGTPQEQAEAVRAAVAGDGVAVVDVQSLLQLQPGEEGYLASAEFAADVGEEDTRIVIYTSGSSGEPKGVMLPYRSYATNRPTFESFLGLEDPALRFTPVLVNPLHHTNSTALSDWALRRPGTRLHLFERYTTGYWAVVARVALGLVDDGDGGETPLPPAGEAADAMVRRQLAAGVCVVCPTVSRHFDFLEGLVEGGRLPCDPLFLKAVAPVVTFLIGSAPVGPGTVVRLMVRRGRAWLGWEGVTFGCGACLKDANPLETPPPQPPPLQHQPKQQNYLGRLPTIRFGSTETCLQVMGTPNRALDEGGMMEAFRRGWEQPEGEPPGFWVGRPHPPFTEVGVGCLMYGIWVARQFVLNVMAYSIDSFIHAWRASR